MTITRMLRHPLPWLALLAVLSVPAQPDLAGADSVDLAPNKDNTLIETPLGNSNGSGDGIYAGRVATFGNGTRRRGLLSFDLSSIPAGATIDTAILELTLSASTSVTTQTISLHQLTAGWGEAGSFGGGTGGLAGIGDATWLHRTFDSALWTSEGGDFLLTESGSQVVTDLGPYTWSGAGLVADVQAWFDSPVTNFGWLVMGNEAEQGTVRKFSSREGLTPPRLHVAFTPSVTGVGDGPRSDAVWFAPPAPAPASGPVRLAISLPRAARVSLAVHDAAGRIVRRLAADVSTAAGRHEFVWDGLSAAGEAMPSGVYVARLVVNQTSISRRVALIH